MNKDDRDPKFERRGGGIFFLFSNSSPFFSLFVSLDYSHAARPTLRAPAAAVVRTPRRSIGRAATAAATTTTAVALRAKFFGGAVSTATKPADAIHAVDVCTSLVESSRTRRPEELLGRWEWTVPAAAAAAKFSVATVFPTTGTDEFEEWLGSLVYANEEFRERAKHVVVFRTK